MQRKMWCWLLVFSLALQPLVLEVAAWAQEPATPETADQQAARVNQASADFEEAYQKLMGTAEVKAPGGFSGFMLKVTGKSKQVKTEVDKANQELRTAKEEMTRLRTELQATRGQVNSAALQNAQAVSQKQLELATKIKAAVSEAMRKAGETLNKVSAVLKKVAGGIATVAGVLAAIPVVNFAAPALFTAAVFLGKISAVVGVAGKTLVTFADKADLSAQDFIGAVKEAKDAWKTGGDQFKAPPSTTQPSGTPPAGTTPGGTTPGGAPPAGTTAGGDSAPGNTTTVTVNPDGSPVLPGTPIQVNTPPVGLPPAPPSGDGVQTAYTPTTANADEEGEVGEGDDEVQVLPTRPLPGGNVLLTPTGTTTGTTTGTATGTKTGTTTGTKTGTTTGTKTGTATGTKTGTTTGTKTGTATGTKTGTATGLPTGAKFPIVIGVDPLPPEYVKDASGVSPNDRSRSILKSAISDMGGAIERGWNMLSQTEAPAKVVDFLSAMDLKLKFQLQSMRDYLEKVKPLQGNILIKSAEMDQATRNLRYLMSEFDKLCGQRGKIMGGAAIGAGVVEKVADITISALGPPWLTMAYNGVKNGLKGALSEGTIKDRVSRALVGSGMGVASAYLGSKTFDSLLAKVGQDAGTAAMDAVPGLMEKLQQIKAKTPQEWRQKAAEITRSEATGIVAKVVAGGAMRQLKDFVPAGVDVSAAVRGQVGNMAESAAKEAILQAVDATITQNVLTPAMEQFMKAAGK